MSFAPFFLTGLLAAQLASAQSLIFKNVTVIDATGAAPHRASLQINAGRIVALAKKIHTRRGDQVIDAKGKFLIPGLWDMHIHLGPPDIFFPLLIANGITGVREMFTGIPLPVINTWRSRPDVPRIFAPGFLDGPPMLWAGPAPPGAIAVATAADGRAGVRALAATGVDFLKIYSSVPREAYFAAAEQARAIGIPFAGHVPEAVSAAEASDAGQRSEEHLLGIMEACSTNESALRAARVALMLDKKMSGEARMRELAFPNPAGLLDTYSETKCAALFQKFVQNGTWQTPTLSLLEGFARMPDQDFIDDPRRKYLPPAWRAQWDPRQTFFLRDLAPPDYRALNQRIHALLDRYEQLVGDMHRAGVQFLAGTDANGANPVYPGFGLHEELALLVKAGLTPLEALESATRNASRYFGNPDFGTIEVGKSADLVLLDANPLIDIRNTEKIEAVVLRGRYYRREALDALLAQVAQIASGKSLQAH
ncbi:MAG TPA: amidohydrolase family protein [Bryobacteraceae bacterium]|nr:amidohydrolase family protein [Bryobacteraceae bacterium]